MDMTPRWLLLCCEQQQWIYYVYWINKLADCYPSGLMAHYRFVVRKERFTISASHICWVAITRNIVLLAEAFPTMLLYSLDRTGLIRLCWSSGRRDLHAEGFQLFEILSSSILVNLFFGSNHQKRQECSFLMGARDGEDQGSERLGADRSGLRSRSEQKILKVAPLR
jgi:hypothetical protein